MSEHLVNRYINFSKLKDYESDINYFVHTGNTPMDIAAAYGDLRVFELIKTKWDTLPAAGGDKKKGKGGTAKPGKSPSPVHDKVG